MKKSDDSPPMPDPDSLEFPDWSGMDDSTSRITPEAALQLCEDYQERVWDFGKFAAATRKMRRRICPLTRRI
jgi:hypothetical protein